MLVALGLAGLVLVDLGVGPSPLGRSVLGSVAGDGSGLVAPCGVLGADRGPVADWGSVAPMGGLVPGKGTGSGEFLRSFYHPTDPENADLFSRVDTDIHVLACSVLPLPVLVAFLVLPRRRLPLAVDAVPLADAPEAGAEPDGREPVSGLAFAAGADVRAARRLEADPCPAGSEVTYA